MNLSRVKIPAGIAIVGSDIPYEGPPCQVEVAGFEMMEHCVTNKEYSQFIQAGGYESPDLWSSSGWKWRQTFNISHPAFWLDPQYNGSAQPVTGVSFHEANAFAKWVGGRLPTEIEWERAARGEDGREFPWGNEPPDMSMANFSPDFVPVDLSAVEVTQHPRNVSPFGCFQMAGNVFEWCSDYFHIDTPQRRIAGVKLEDRASPRRVLKGGAWVTGISRLRCAARWSYSSEFRDNIVGIRVAFDTLRT
ncbi:formylglycine-generating enzyme family protein [Billgrantia desiderata]|uniref:formylglycine-generating enzyme family protein n=1 Tax=Billgrantia desiderata TaxID=52021 RepID=UPI00174C8EF3|nr:SUMF1/EgtB/PvdO family nonheme iron enzyme [Halomonas desiderata]MCE8011588.1 SUMF1/EgtB/PvdO family nonheme iron enzyme [Halomonas desiderata]NIC37676.1 formylglycine-generating enzyme family protein [Halomonas desiderata]